MATERDAIRCAIELRLQLYNTKLALPRTSDSGCAEFSHLDCDWQRPGCLEAPAPQAFVATSPQVVEGRTVFSARFVDVDARIREWHAKQQQDPPHTQC